MGVLTKTMRDGLDCPVAALLAMTKSRVAGEVVSPLFRENLNPTLSLRARQGVAIQSPHFFVIARKVSKRTDVAIQSEA